MKQLIITFAFCMLFVTFMIYQQDNNRYLREMEKLKHVADEAAATGGLYFDAQQYGEGKLIFNQDKAGEAISQMTKKLMDLDNSNRPASDGYWMEQIQYDVYYFDQTNIIYPYLFADPKTAYTMLITQPTVIVTINAGKPRYRLPFLVLENTIRSGSYEYKTR